MEVIKQIALSFLITLMVVSALSLFVREGRHSKIIKPLLGAYMALCLISSVAGNYKQIEFDFSGIEVFSEQQSELRLKETYEIIVEREIAKLLKNLGIESANISAEVNIENKTSIYCHKVEIEVNEQYRMREQDIRESLYEFCLVYPEIRFTG